MKKKVNIIILCFLLIVLCSLLFIENREEVFFKIIAPKYYIKFDDLEKVIISYNPSNSPFEEYHSISEYPQLQDIPPCQIEVTDETFLKLIEDNYRNKIVSSYNDGGVLGEGNFKIIINDSISLCTHGYIRFLLKHENKFLPVEYNKEIFDKMVEIILNNNI